MESHWAAQDLQTIRTLMERAAIYRRALAPVMIRVGSLGLFAAAAGYAFGWHAPQRFVAYWICVGVVGLAAALLTARRQAFKASEPFWSPATRRVAQALAPPLTAGLLGSAVMLPHLMRSNVPEVANVIGMLWIPVAWIVLYGCALHAAGFFMKRGIKLFGRLLILAGCAVFAAGVPDLDRAAYAYGLMGGCFGVLHLAYGVYLYFTEPRKNEA
jgi:hypothetical protein